MVSMIKIRDGLIFDFYMGLSHVHIAELPLGTAHTHFVDLLNVHASKDCVWASPFTEVHRHFKCGNVIEYTRE